MWQTVSANKRETMILNVSTNENKAKVTSIKSYKMSVWALGHCKTLSNIIKHRIHVWEQDDELTQLPCCHEFHTECVTAWLNKAANCPLCRWPTQHIISWSSTITLNKFWIPYIRRKTFPTDDPEWEEMQKQKIRAKKREEDLEMLHNSMFG